MDARVADACVKFGATLALGARLRVDTAVILGAIVMADAGVADAMVILSAGLIADAGLNSFGAALKTDAGLGPLFFDAAVGAFA
jgi:hypothetical protein